MTLRPLRSSWRSRLAGTHGVDRIFAATPRHGCSAREGVLGDIGRQR